MSLAYPHIPQQLLEAFTRQGEAKTWWAIAELFQIVSEIAQLQLPWQYHYAWVILLLQFLQASACPFDVFIGLGIAEPNEVGAVVA